MKDLLLPQTPNTEADFDLTDKQWEAVLNEWEFKEELLR
jgi:hypothetical protein